MSVTDPRSALLHTGSYVSIPEAFNGADKGVKFAPKIAVGVGRFDDARHPLKLDLVMDPHQLLLDLEAVDPGAIDLDKIVRDCDLVKKVALTHPEKLSSIAAAFGSDVPHKQILAAARTIEEVGLSEEQVARSGGGLVQLLVLLGLLAAASCKGCAHTKGRVRQT